MASPGAAERAPAAPALYTRDYWTACVVHFTGALSLEMFVLVPLLIREVGGTELTIGLALGFGVAASVAFRPVVGTLLDRIGRRRVLLWCGFVNAVSWLPFLAVTSVGPLLYA
ncbi:MAG: MFS transporter, partial [Deltaproteobacteria bacterium]|nr:MFS transporter [Deltaproteobacteria bacterium]